MLRVQINREASVPFDFSLSAEKFCGENFLDNGKFVGEIKISGEVVNDGSSYVARGKIFCCKEFTCDRCLSAAAENQSHDFEEELDAADIDEDFVDITALVRDTLITSQPMKNLCKIDCKGLCPSCGKNLNDGDCDCDNFIVDPRLAPLLDF